MRKAVLLARKLRREQTEAESIFWEQVRNRRFLDLKFIRQKVVPVQYGTEKRFFIADFYCAEKRLIIEIDGGIHLKQKEYDQLREEILRAYAYDIVRFTNDQLHNSIEEVLKQLSIKLTS